MTNHAFKSGCCREQASFLPPRVEDYVDRNNPVRAIEAYVEALGFATPGGVAAGRANRPTIRPTF